MSRSIFVNCPTCKAENAITVRVGTKATCRQTGCISCHARFDYSAWVIKRSESMVFHQVDLIPVAAKEAK